MPARPHRLPIPPHAFSCRLLRSISEFIFRSVVVPCAAAVTLIQRELLMLRFDVSERTLSGRVIRMPSDAEPAGRKLAFPLTHLEEIAPIAFFTVRTIPVSKL